MPKSRVPGGSSSHTLNNLGRETLERKRNVLIIDDQVFSGNSLKSLVNLCRNYGTNIEKIRIYVVIESMLRAEKKLFSTFLQNLQNKNHIPINIKLNAYMRFPVNKYWDAISCPICKLRMAFEKNTNLKNQFIESHYANKRLFELQPSLLDYETKSRKPLVRLEEAQTIYRNKEESITVTTLEGYELYCESVYVQGDIKWLVEGLRPGNPNIFPPDVIITVVDLLSQDVSLLFRVRLRKKLIENLIGLLDANELKGKKLSRFLEVLANFPLYFLKNDLWKQIWESIFKEHPKTFYQCYPGAQFLLQEVARRPNHPLRNNLLDEFDKYVDVALERLPKEVEFKRKGQMINCLQRSYQFEQAVSLSWLIAQISQLVVYPIKDEISTHQVLYRDLLKLVSISSENHSSDFIGTIQMLGHLRYCLEELISQFTEQASSFSSLQEYKDLRNKIDELQNNFPYERKFGETFNSVILLAQSILQILFPNNQIDKKENNFQVKLESLLNKYTKSQ